MSKFFETIGKESIFLLIGSLFVLGSQFLESSFFVTFLQENLVQLQIALLAINATTLSVILAKLREITDGNIFKNTFTAMKESVIEQVVLIVLAIVILILSESVIINTSVTQAKLILMILLSDVFFHCIQITYDTAKAIFILFENI